MVNIKYTAQNLMVNIEYTAQIFWPSILKLRKLK